MIHFIMNYFYTNKPMQPKSLLPKYDIGLDLLSTKDSLNCYFRNGSSIYIFSPFFEMVPHPCDTTSDFRNGSYLPKKNERKKSTLFFLFLVSFPLITASSSASRQSYVLTIISVIRTGSFKSPTSE